MLVPASAGAHATISMPGGTIVYSALDATSQSTVTANVTDANVRITDTTIFGGIDPGPCEPGQVDRQGYIVEAICPRSGGTRMRLEVGGENDEVAVREATGATPMPAVVLGGSGDDRVRGGGAADQVDGGPGSDSIEGGPGDDAVYARDGGSDFLVSCGAGSDRAYLDVTDLADGCEAVEHADGPAPPPPEEPPPSADTTPPEIDGSAARRQRMGRAATLRATATVNEAADLSATARIRAGSRTLRFTAPHVRVSPGERVRIALRCSRAARRALRRALASGRPVYAGVTITAVDETGNSLAEPLPRVRLLR